jgi:Arc/MetJ-type ribon-helix-helix transcriptional regulator
VLIHIFIPMHQVIVELDDRMFERLNRVAPPRNRKRSDFIREAIRRALDERVDEQMERAYRQAPQAAEEADLDPTTWEPVKFARKKRTAR